MKTLGSLGRIIFAIPFIVFGIMNFMDTEGMANALLTNWPIAEALVYISGLALILAGLSIIIKVQAKIACLLLALLLLIIIVAIHVPDIVNGDIIARSKLLKDLALLGASLTYANILGK
jgi:putative oxidoreductase